VVDRASIEWRLMRLTERKVAQIPGAEPASRQAKSGFEVSDDDLPKGSLREESGFEVSEPDFP
jgi:hypothetical protein